MLHSSNLVIHIYHSVGRYTSVPLSNLQPALSSIGTSWAVPQPAAFPSTWMGCSPLSCASPPSASRSGASNPPGQGLLCLHGIDFFIIAILNIVAQIYDLIKINQSFTITSWISDVVERHRDRWCHMNQGQGCQDQSFNPLHLLPPLFQR